MAGDPLVTPHAVIDWWTLSAVEAGWGCFDSHGLGAEGGASMVGRRCGERSRIGAGPSAWIETYSDFLTSIDPCHCNVVIGTDTDTALTIMDRVRAKDSAPIVDGLPYRDLLEPLLGCNRRRSAQGARTNFT